MQVRLSPPPRLASGQASLASSPAASVWSYYTNSPGFLLAGDLLLAGEAATDQECAEACLQQGQAAGGAVACQAWAWCGAFFTDGCQVLNYPGATADAVAALLPPGTCLLSGPPVAGELTSTAMYGDAVTWSSGFYDSSLAAATGAPPLVAGAAANATASELRYSALPVLPPAAGMASVAVG